MSQKKKPERKRSLEKEGEKNIKMGIQDLSNETTNLAKSRGGGSKKEKISRQRRKLEN